MTLNAVIAVLKSISLSGPSPYPRLRMYLLLTLEGDTHIAWCRTFWKSPDLYLHPSPFRFE
jgi:hypothetical protein